MKLKTSLYAFILALMPSIAAAEEAAKPDSGDTAWMITACALVLFMTIPGLSLFYAGMARSKNVLSIMMQCLTITGIATILWVIGVYSIAFGNGGDLNSVWGGLSDMFMGSLTAKDANNALPLVGTIPRSVHAMFQLTFAIITPALIIGAFAERMKFGAIVAFVSAWLVLVYGPVCHWVWAEGGFLYSDGVIDFAGGTVVHINAGIAGLIACIMVGKRKGFPTTKMPPHSLVLTCIGTGMLWVGWFGFNAGSALTAGHGAGMAMFTTQIAAATATITWVGIEWIFHKKPSALGAASGAIAGLVAITPACGNVGPMGALVIGFISAICCFLGATKLKQRFGYDDSLDAFGVHGIGGTVGAVLAGIFCAPALGGIGFGTGHEGIGSQLTAQIVGIVVTYAYSGVITFILLKIIDKVIGLRVSEEEETEGLDIAVHGEQGYNL